MTARLASRSSTTFAVQEPQLGTGHALLQAEPALAGKSGTVVVLSGDVPLLRPETLDRLVRTHIAHGAAATVLTATVADPTRLRPDRPHGRAASPRSSSIGTRRRGPGDHRDQQRHLRLRSRAAVRRAARDRLGERAGRVLPPRSRPDVSRARPGRGDRAARRPDRDARGQQPARAGGGRGAAARPQERRADGRRRDDHRSRRRPGSSRTSRSAPTPSSTRASTCRAARPSAARCELQSNVRIVDSTLGDDVRREQLLRDRDVARRIGRAARPVRAPPPAVATSASTRTSATSSS